jgi:2-isopropylmalate synthase
MWHLLRDRQLNGVKFRRQVPIGPFVADFASIEYRLVVELDGSQHAENPSDISRTNFLISRGWGVVRFWNNDVMKNREGVWESLQQAPKGSPAGPGEEVAASAPRQAEIKFGQARGQVIEGGAPACAGCGRRQRRRSLSRTDRA